MPISGSCRYTLPCKVDTVNINDQAKVTRSELQVIGYRVGNKDSSTYAVSINVTRGNLKMVAQCVNGTTYIDGMMVRVGKSPIFKGM